MIFMCVKEFVKPSFLDRDNGIRQQTPSQFQKQVNCLFCIRVLSENQKEAFWTSYFKRTAEAAGVSSIVGTQSESLAVSSSWLWLRREEMSWKQSTNAQ